MSSILTDTKKLLGVDDAYTVFDVDIVTHINTVFTVLTDLGIGPAEGFSIADKTATWDQYLSNDLRLNSIKTYIYLRVRRLFDPPVSAFLLTAINEQISELEWRLNVKREEETFPYVPPVETCDPI